MKKALIVSLLFLILFLFPCDAKTQDKVRIHGVITYFDGTPVDNANVELKQNNFRAAYATLTNEIGEYELFVKPGRYLALFACKDYGVKNLEFWSWNVIAYNDLEINARIDGLEVYAMNAFMVQGTPSHVIYIYFRPMSLTKSNEWGKKPLEEQENAAIADTAPKLEKDDIQVLINGETAEIFLLDRILEQSSEKQGMFGYLIQVRPPAVWKTAGLLKIFITIKDGETGEQGEGCVFLESSAQKYM